MAVSFFWGDWSPYKLVFIPMHQQNYRASAERDGYSEAEIHEDPYFHKYIRPLIYSSWKRPPFILLYSAEESSACEAYFSNKIIFDIQDRASAERDGYSEVDIHEDPYFHKYIRPLTDNERMDWGLMFNEDVRLRQKFSTTVYCRQNSFNFQNFGARDSVMIDLSAYKTLYSSSFSKVLPPLTSVEDSENDSIIDYQEVDYYCLSACRDSDDNEDDNEDRFWQTSTLTKMKIRMAILNIEFAFQSLHIVKLFNPMLCILQLCFNLLGFWIFARNIFKRFFPPHFPLPSRNIFS